MQVQSLGREDSLEEGMVTHSTVLVWRIPEPGLWSIGLQSRTQLKLLSMHTDPFNAHSTANFDDPKCLN